MTIYDRHQLAVRYATAFLDVIEQPLSVSECEALTAIITHYKRTPELLFFLQISLFSHHDKEAALARMRDWYKLPTSITKIDILLLNHQRIFLLPLVYGEIITQSHLRANRMVCTVTTAIPLTAAYQKKCYLFIEQLSAQTPLITWSIDPALVAGVKIQATEWLWEDSINGRLKALSARVSV